MVHIVSTDARLILDRGGIESNIVQTSATLTPSESYSATRYAQDSFLLLPLSPGRCTISASAPSSSRRRPTAT